MPFSSVPEAKKEAQKAILRLLPHGVKYQTYIDEGFDDKLVKTLFTELNLVPSATSPPVQQPSTTQAPKEKPAQTQQVPQDPKAAAMTKKQEERKDRIARLLAEKAAKAAAAGSSATETATEPSLEAPGNAPAAGTKTSMTKAEKDRLLQQKMEALKKSRATRAQKTDVVQESKQDTPLQLAQTSSAVVQTREPAMIGQLTAPNAPPPVKAQTSVAYNGSSQASAPPPAPATYTSAMPGVPIASLPTQPINQRKRPVASDFVDYPAATVKRPFLPERQDSSLVIDVSDDESEEDDDVEMEMDSAADDSSGSNRNAFSLPRRGGPAVRDYPPLTNMRFQRQPSNPPSGTSGPSRTAHDRTKESEYEAKMRQIAEYKKMIEAKEALVKAKQGTSTPRTPIAGLETPPEVQDVSVMTQARPALPTINAEASSSSSVQSPQQLDSVKLPNRTELAAAERDLIKERRMRISNVQLPQVEVKVSEKKSKAKLLQEELQRLQAEIDEDEAEQKRLQDEIGELGPEPSPEPTEPSPQQSALQQQENVPGK